MFVRNATHELIGVSLALAAAKVVEADALETVGLAAASLCGSRLPDVDQLGARVHRRSRLERRSLLVGATGAALRGPLLVFAVVVRHRGVAHSAVACVATAGFAALVAASAGPATALVVGAGVGVGYAAHLAADACTPGGVCLWAPLSGRRVWLLPARARVPTGSLREVGLAAAMVAALAGVLLA
jgi:membrane-bound metal-dependent hydrolase YbcI (DUF457 family)